VAIEVELDLLERSIRQLQIEWDKFFGGIEKKPPNEMKTRVEALVRKYSLAEIRNNAARFRYQGLQARYSTMSELWSKRLRAFEEGRPMGVHGARALAQVAAPAPAAAAASPSAAAAAAAAAAAREVRVKDPAADSGAVRELYERFVAARRETGEPANVRFDSFEKLIAQQASRILSQKGAAAVDFRLETKDGKVSLKAKAVR
jgi:hypothetical protein